MSVQSPSDFGIDDAQMEAKLAMVQGLVAQPVPHSDPQPGRVGDRLFVGNKHHVADVQLLLALGVTAVLNCAPSGIRNLPLGAYKANGIRYAFTNVAEDAHHYPILHRRTGAASEHFEVAKAFYDEVLEAGGTALFFCVAGQNRSATLAIAVQVARGQSLQRVLSGCASSRPFILENLGFQRQLVELEALQERSCGSKRPSPENGNPQSGKRPCLGAPHETRPEVVVEVLVPGLRTFNVAIPSVATIDGVREVLVQRVNAHLLAEAGCAVGKAWLVFTTFGNGEQFDLILEEVALEAAVQVERLRAVFGLEAMDDPASADCRLRWSSSCRFELVLFSVTRAGADWPEPFVFRHQERPGAPGTLLAESLADPHLRAWDFVTGEAFRSATPIVFSYSTDPSSRRDFMNISTSREGERQQFTAPGEGGILGMGNNAIVHHVELEAVQRAPATPASPVPPVSPGLFRLQSLSDAIAEKTWDAAVKRAFSLPKMLGALETKAEAGTAKRLRMAGALNRHGRLLYTYGVGIALASDNNNHDEYKFEATLLSQYQQDFASYTMKRFMEDYTTVTARARLQPEERARIETLQVQFSLIKVKVLLVSLLNAFRVQFSLIKVKVLLVSLLNAFRDLTLMGVQAFDFNHLNNVLVSRDYRHARLIDIDGNSKGSIQVPSNYFQCLGGDADSPTSRLHKPALDVDLSTLLPVVIQELLFGKGRGKQFVNDQIHKVRRAKSEDAAKAIIRSVLRENFFPDCQWEDADGTLSPTSPRSGSPRHKHLCKVVEWFYAMLLKKDPWAGWTNDIYDAMRCIDHLPIH